MLTREISEIHNKKEHSNVLAEGKNPQVYNKDAAVREQVNIYHTEGVSEHDIL